MASTADRASGEMAVEVGEIPVEGTRLAADDVEVGEAPVEGTRLAADEVEVGEAPVEGTRLAADEAEVGVTFGGAVGAQAETSRKIPQTASSAR